MGNEKHSAAYTVKEFKVNYTVDVKGKKHKPETKIVLDMFRELLKLKPNIRWKLINSKLHLEKDVRNAVNAILADKKAHTIASDFKGLVPSYIVNPVVDNQKKFEQIVLLLKPE